jgi:hypothetical protein
MKINTRKSVIFTALAVMVLATALVIGCTSPLDGSLGVYEPTAPGTGRVKLSINNRNASRTILPTALPGNLRYWITFDGSSPHDAGDTDSSNPTINNIPIGSYTGITVIVYTKADAANDAAGAATLAIGGATYTNNINVTSGSTVGPFTIPTDLYTPGSQTGNGTFAYNITYNDVGARLSSVKFNIVSRGTPSYNSTNNTATLNTLTTFGGGTPTPIPAGYHNVIFTLTDASGTTVSFYQILHVYKNMTSTFTSTFTDTLFPVPSSPGSGTITIGSPGLPGDARVTLLSSDTDVATVAPGTSGASTPAIIVNLIDDGTVNLTLTVSSAIVVPPIPVINITAVNRLISGAITPLATSAGLAFTTPPGTSTSIVFAVDTTKAPFDALANTADYIIQVDGTETGGGPLSLPPIIFKKGY